MGSGLIDSVNASNTQDELIENSKLRYFKMIWVFTRDVIELPKCNTNRFCLYI